MKSTKMFHPLLFAFLVLFTSFVFSEPTCSDLSLNLSEPTSGTEEYEGISYPRYSTGRIHYSPVVSEDCIDSKDVWISTTIETYDENGNVSTFDQLPVKTAYVIHHQGDSEQYDYPDKSRDFVWFHVYLCSDPNCVDYLIDFVGDVIYIGERSSDPVVKGTGLVSSSSMQKAILAVKPKKGSLSSSHRNSTLSSNSIMSHPILYFNVFMMAFGVMNLV